MMAEFLEQAEPVVAELDRGLRVFRPSGRITQFNLPDSFYDRTADEVQVWSLCICSKYTQYKICRKIKRV